ncbi:unnamed protein product [Danaus chrysippus]|uniref:(African queen) hypothetical protein n=1 Tax=Danaus chrysippus TaxID=151541 RepID=A0A8J2QKD2_9NEOP|nr:unnamed protein product [Danaus chrysippus]
MSVIQVGPEPMPLICPACHASVKSKVEHSSTTGTHIMAALLCLCLCWPCVCVPYCVDSCQNADHYCPSCNAYLGTYKR